MVLTKKGKVRPEWFISILSWLIFAISLFRGEGKKTKTKRRKIASVRLRQEIKKTRKFATFQLRPEITKRRNFASFRFFDFATK